MNNHIGSAFTSLLLAFAALPTVAQAQLCSSRPSRFVYYFFKQAQALRVDPTRVAVYAPGGIEVTSLPALVAPSSVEPGALPGWSFLSLTTPTEGDDALTATLGVLAEQPGWSFVSPVFVDELGGPMLVTPQLLVRFVEGVDNARAESILAAVGAGAVVERDWAGMRGAFRVQFAGHDGLEALLVASALAHRCEVAFAEPDFLCTAHLAQASPDDASFVWAWGLHSTGINGYDADFDMGALKAWTYTLGDPAIRVVILDQGIDPHHPDLNQDPGADFTGFGVGGGPVNADDNHGTWVAGCVSAVAGNGLGTSGIAPHCKVVSARVIHLGVFQESWLVNAVAWAASQGIRITSTAITLSYPWSAADAMYQQTRVQNRMIHFASSGNGGLSVLAYPARSDWVNGVGAVAPNGRRATFSQYGAGLDFVAPGVDIFTTDRAGVPGFPGDYMLGTGTSYAAPYAAGVAALILSVRPTLPPAGIERLLRESARDLEAPGYDIYTGWGMIRADRALALLAGEDLGDVTPRTNDAPSFSEDGRFVAFSSYSPYLVAGDTNGQRDVFVRDIVGGTVVRVSVSSMGSEGNLDSRQPRITADGRFVCFESWASNLVSGDTNSAMDIFLRDMATGTTQRVSVSNTGAQANLGASFPSLSANGRYIAFQSDSTSLTSGTGGGRFQIYVRDVILGTTTLVSRSATGAGNGDSMQPSISDGGGRVAFRSAAPNLVVSDTNGTDSDVFVYDCNSATMAIASLDQSGQQAQGPPYGPQVLAPHISGDGTSVAFNCWSAL